MGSLDTLYIVPVRIEMSHNSTTKLFNFPGAATEITSQLTTRILNILQSPVISRYEIVYKLYRRQSERLATLQFANNSNLYCFCGSEIYALGSEYENLLLKLKTWILRQTMKISGSVHEIERSVIGCGVTRRRTSIGMITQGPSSKGLVLDVRETQENVLETALESDEQMLQDIMGPIYQNLFLSMKSDALMTISTGSSLSSETTVKTGELQAAMSYFELFSKI